jgi:molybdopterin molybdotransferase
MVGPAELLISSAHRPIRRCRWRPLRLWVEAGDGMPEGCDCVIDADSIDQTGSMAQALVEAIPGQGVRRGGDIAANSAVITSGRRLRPLDLLVARAAELHQSNVRRPRLSVINIPGPSSNATTAQLISDDARAAGANVIFSDATGREAASVAKAVEVSGFDMLITVGGTGVGRTDATIAALGQRGEIVAHGIALQPGRTSAVGWIAKIPVIALPGMPDQALAAWWMLGLPVLDRLAGLSPRERVTLPLARKIASSVGLAEIVLLERTEGHWMPLATGDLSLGAIARADAWVPVPGGSEGFAAGTPVDGYIIY